MTATFQGSTRRDRLVAPARRQASLTLADEHRRLFSKVAAMVSDLETATAEDRWPPPELRSLIDCLRTDVLSQAAHEEQRWFGSVGVARLSRDHARLRAGVEALARTADGEGSHSREQLAATVQSLLLQLQRHLQCEGRVLAVSGDAEPAVTEPATRCAS